MAEFVATLVPRPGERLDEKALKAAATILVPDTPADIVDDGAAANICFDSGDHRAMRDALVDVLHAFATDAIVQPMAHRRKRLLISDMDSTVIAQECIDELADFAGVKTKVSDITERTMRGELAFEPALKERVALLKGLPLSAVDAVLAERISITPGAEILVRTMRANGAVTALVSGGFTLFTSPVAFRVGFAINRGNTLVTDGDTLDGSVREPILGQESKRRTLIELAARGIDLKDTLALGDGANDLAMIETAGLGVAWRAKPAVAAAADARLEFADLTALLYAQGYHKADFVAH
jgi:phosphoserine phosphatase